MTVNGPDNDPGEEMINGAIHLNRDDLLEMSEDFIKKLHRRLMAQRFRSKSTDPALLSMMRVFLQLLQAHNNILRDREIDELNERIQKLERR